MKAIRAVDTMRSEVPAGSPRMGTPPSAPLDRGTRGPSGARWRTRWAAASLGSWRDQVSRVSLTAYQVFAGRMASDCRRGGVPRQWERAKPSPAPQLSRGAPPGSAGVRTWSPMARLPRRSGAGRSDRPSTLYAPAAGVGAVGARSRRVAADPRERSEDDGG